MKCITHSSKNLVPHNTKYGIRFTCPVGGCTVFSWNGNPPADYSTRQARIKAHEALDHLWKSGMLKRSNAYRKLARFLDIKEAHIANFDKEQCDKVIKFGNDIWRDK